MDSFAKMPDFMLTLWLKFIANKLQTLPAAPNFSSNAAKISFEILAWVIVPAHIAQGSRVVYKMQSVNLVAFKVLQADFIALISAWAVRFLSLSTELNPREIISLFFTTIAPTGTSPFCSAIFAQFRACCIKNISFIRQYSFIKR